VTPALAAAPRAAPPRPDRRSAPRRPALAVLERRPARRGRLLRLLAAVLLCGALLTVVVAHSLLAESQLRLGQLQSRLATEQALHRQLLATVAEAENPARIVAEAKKLGLVEPTTVTQLPAVPLGTASSTGAAGTRR